ncbi:unnamed protein product [Clonostachys rhizophaga]|uniref:Carboxylic ester hydrolase n=1 Tax=Clonostachys rhizophaga TaxID=160324 RepID=A0A9N9VLD8_9HYPO|nr:unnamed protein product [Clonostachys rhizophaga]
MLLQFLISAASCAVFAGSVLAAAAPSNAPIVEVSNGSYYGKYNSVYNQDIFLGIPYAQPPVKDLRFAPPKSLNTTWSGLRNATEYGYACVGYGEDTEDASKNFTNEDCLTLNIARPAGKSSKPLPVAVWIHGGGWVYGSSAVGLYNTTFLVERSVQMGEPIIAVSFNYRLAAWGFLYNDQIAKEGQTNAGLRDQRLALHWVKENIAAFGGDPEKITIFGESAGSVSVFNHVLAYNGRDDKLFSGAIGQSGSIAGLGGQWQPTTDKVALATYNITQTVCPDATDKLACLRKAKFEDLNNAINASLSIPVAASPNIYGPYIDGDIVARSMANQLKDGDYVKIPIIMGTNNDESVYFVPPGLNSEADIQQFLLGSFVGLNLTQANAIQTGYKYDDPEQCLPGIHRYQLNSTVGIQLKRAVSILSDLTFIGPTHYGAQLVSKNNYKPLYVYNFNASISVGPNYYGAAHGYELAYTFYNLNGTGWEGDKPPFLGGNPFIGRSKSYLELADVMSGMWIGFFNHGVPGYKNQPVPKWPAYKGGDGPIMIFDAQPNKLNTRNL